MTDLSDNDLDLIEGMTGNATIEILIAEVRRHRAASVLDGEALRIAGRGAIQTVTGREFYPLAPRPEDICITDVARGIAARFRYGGHTRELYTVAEHSVIVSYCVPPAHAGRALLHDAAEGYLVDMVRPIKHHPAMAAYRAIEDNVQRCVYTRFKIDPDDPVGTAAVNEADNRILVDEVAQITVRPEMFAGPLGDMKGYDHPLLCLEPLDAERAFLNRFRQLFPRSMWA